MIEERQKELSPNLVWGVRVQGSWLLQEIDVSEQLLGTGAKVVVSPRELLFDGAALHRDRVQLFAELRARYGAIRGKLDESLFLSFQLVGLLAEVVAHLALHGLHLVDRVGELPVDLEQIGGRDAFRRDNAGDRCFDLIHPNGRRRAKASLLRRAQVVLVDAAIAAVHAVDESARASVSATFPAHQQSTKVVKMDAVSITLPVAAV